MIKKFKLVLPERGKGLSIIFSRKGKTIIKKLGH